MKRRDGVALVVLATAALLVWAVAEVARCDEPLNLPCQPRGEVLLAEFLNFKDIPDHVLFYHAGGDESFELADSSITDPELVCSRAQVEWLVGLACVGCYTYQYPGTLFPAGSQLEAYQLRWDILCADLSSCATWPYQVVFPNNNHFGGLYWHGERLDVSDNARNATFSWSRRGNGQGWEATLVVNAVESNIPNDARIAGALMTLPQRFGRNGKTPTVRLSIARLRCP